MRDRQAPQPFLDLLAKLPLLVGKGRKTLPGAPGGIDPNVAGANPPRARRQRTPFRGGESDDQTGETIRKIAQDDGFEPKCGEPSLEIRRSSASASIAASSFAIHTAALSGEACPMRSSASPHHPLTQQGDWPTQGQAKSRLRQVDGRRNNGAQD